MNVKQLILGLALFNVLAIFYFLTISSQTINSASTPRDQRSGSSDHTNTFLSEDQTTKEPVKPKSNKKAPQKPDTSDDDDDNNVVHAQPIDNDNDDDDIMHYNSKSDDSDAPVVDTSDDEPVPPKKPVTQPKEKPVSQPKDKSGSSSNDKSTKIPAKTTPPNDYKVIKVKPSSDTDDATPPPVKSDKNTDSDDDDDDVDDDDDGFDDDDDDDSGDDDRKSTKKSKKAAELPTKLDLEFDGKMINPFRVLGFYKEVEMEYFAPIYKRKKSMYDGVMFALKVDRGYCDRVDFFNMYNHSNLFESMNFVTQYGGEGLVNSNVVDAIGVNVLPELSKPKSNYSEPSIEHDIRATMFFTKKHDFHYSQKIGTQFLCAAQMYGHIPGNSIITRKDWLTGTVNAYSDFYASKPHCFNKSTIMPRSYRLRNKTECDQFFAEIASDEYLKKKQEVPLQFMIKQGFGAHRGTGVFLFDEEQESFIRKQFSNGTTCGEVETALVAQKYIPNPIVLDRNNKFDFRMYMLIASIDPVILFYHDGFLRVSLTEYDLNSTDRSTHLTNTHLSKEIFAADSDGNETLEEEMRDYQMWTLEELQEYLLETGKISDPNWLNNTLRPKFKKAYIHVVRMSRHGLWKHSSVFEMFGLDFMLDEDFNLWLIECNSSPQLIGTNPVKEKLMTTMLKDLFEIEYAYLRSKMKRLLAIVSEFSAKVFTKKPFDLEAERKRFAAANKNYLEPEFKIKEENTWVKIMDENLPGKKAYIGNIEDECLIEFD